MYDSEITVKELIDEVKSEADIAPDIPDTAWLQWYNELIQLCYGEIIHDRVAVTCRELGSTSGDTALDRYGLRYYQPDPASMLGMKNDYIRFDDIATVYYGSEELMKTTVPTGILFERMWFDVTNQLSAHRFEQDPADNICIIAIKGKELEPLTAIVNVRPGIVTTGIWTITNVILPIEFVGMVKAKLRGEAYKLANEDNLAAKWLADYNNQIETFRYWCETKRARFGR